MNVYDFDNTILKGDTEAYFFDYIVKNKLLRFFQMKRFKRLVKGRQKSEEQYCHNNHIIYRIIATKIKNLDKLIETFWDEHEHFVKPFYEKIRKEDDLISSATPSFLLIPIFKRLNIKNYIATEFNFEKLYFDEGFNYGEDKAKKFLAKYGANVIDTFYSDSDSDVYLAKLAKKAIKVIDSDFVDWDFKD